MSFIDGKWKGVILYHLMSEGILRFNELRRRLPSVTPRMLTRQLRELEEAALLSRTVFPVVPPRVDYALTARGESLKPVIMALKAWGDENVLCDGDRMTLKPITAGTQTGLTKRSEWQSYWYFSSPGSGNPRCRSYLRS